MVSSGLALCGQTVSRLNIRKQTQGDFILPELPVSTIISIRLQILILGQKIIIVKKNIYHSHIYSKIAGWPKNIKLNKSKEQKKS